MNPQCRRIQEELLAAALGEIERDARDRVFAHVAACSSCNAELLRYRALDGVVRDLGAQPCVAESASRERLRARLVDFRSRLLTYCVVASPLGRICIARSELGVALVTFLRRHRTPNIADHEFIEGRGQEFEHLGAELMEYLDGQRSTLDWRLDFRLARSDFQKCVLEATSKIPPGAVTSYAHVAKELGRPKATRAVAQALRKNPLPLVVPCHRVVGADGTLTGYDGNRIGLKRRILAVEGILTSGGRGEPHVRRDVMYVRYESEADYCLPTCGDLSRRSLSELTLFATRESAESTGLRPCSSCRPDARPMLA